MRYNMIPVLLATAIAVGGAVTAATPTARAADALACFVDVTTVERGESEVHFGFQAHCSTVADTFHTDTRLWRSDKRGGIPVQRGATRTEDVMLQQDMNKSYIEPCQANAPTGYWHAEVTFTAKKGNAKDTDTVINTEAPPAIAC